MTTQQIANLVLQKEARRRNPQAVTGTCSGALQKQLAKQSAFEDEVPVDESSLDMEDPEVQGAILRALQAQEPEEIPIPRAHRGLVGLLSAAGPLMGGFGAAAAAPAGKGWAQFLGTGLGALGGQSAGALAARHLLTGNPRLQALAQILGTVGGGLLGQRMVGYGNKEASDDDVDSSGHPILRGMGMGAGIGAGAGALLGPAVYLHAEHGANKRMKELLSLIPKKYQPGSPFYRAARKRSLGIPKSWPRPIAENLRRLSMLKQQRGWNGLLGMGAGALGMLGGAATGMLGGGVLGGLRGNSDAG
jgi:hypothetical protein